MLCPSVLCRRQVGAWIHPSAVPHIARIILADGKRRQCARGIPGRFGMVARCSHPQAVTLKRHTLTGALAGKRRGVCCGRAVSVMITLLAFGISGAAPLTTVSATLRLAPCGVAASARR